jgi:hypothetical protein
MVARVNDPAIGGPLEAMHAIEPAGGDLPDVIGRIGRAHPEAARMVLLAEMFGSLPLTAATTRGYQPSVTEAVRLFPPSLISTAKITSGSSICRAESPQN